MNTVERAQSSDAASSQYGKKSREYFGHIRREILPLLPERAPRVLEIGCGGGGTLAFLRQKGICDWVCGVEISPTAAELARQQLDLVLEGSIEALTLPIENNSLDLILCLDVLEHLVDPWSTLLRLVPLLKDDAVLIASIPNVRHYSVLIPLALRGRWDYHDSGILDKSHLRFFTRATATELIASSGLNVEHVRSTNFQATSWKYKMLNALTLTLLRPYFEFQFLIAGKKVPNRLDPQASIFASEQLIPVKK